MSKYKPPVVRGAYSYDPAENSNESTIKEWEPTLTQQNQAEDADINTIVKRFGLTGQLPNNLRTPTYADFEDIFDYHSARNAIAAANSSFQQLQPEIRGLFDNDPAKFVDYCSDPKNLDNLREWGLAVPKAPQTPPASPTGSGNTGAPVQPPGAPEGSKQPNGEHLKSKGGVT